MPMIIDPDECPHGECGACAECVDENFEPPDIDYSQDGRGEVEWESPE